MQSSCVPFFNLTHVAHAQPHIILLFERAMESEDASTAVPEALVFMTTNSSFRNQPAVAAAVFFLFCFLMTILHNAWTSNSKNMC